METDLSHGLDALVETHEARKPGDSETHDERPLEGAHLVNARRHVEKVVPTDTRHGYREPNQSIPGYKHQTYLERAQRHTTFVAEYYYKHKICLDIAYLVNAR